MYLTKVMKAQLAIYTDELKTLELPVPIEVQEYFNWFVDQHYRSGITFVEHISERNGYLFQRTFCLHAHGKSRPATLRETGRRYEGYKMMCSNVVSYYLQPYQADDKSEPEDMHESGWSPMYAGLIKKNTNTMFEYPAVCVNKEEWLAKYPYCQWDTYSFHGKAWGISFFKFLCHYRDNPKIELLIKAGYRNFVGCSGLNMKGKNFKEIFGIKQEFAEDYLKHGSMIDRNILKSNEWIQDIKTLDKYKRVSNNKQLKEFTSDERKYVVLNNNDAYIYRDYLRFAKELGYPLNENKFHFPKDLKTAHDKAEKKLEVIRSKESNEKIKSLIDKCQEFRYEKNGYSIFPMSCAEDLIKESKVLDHCVRTYIPYVAKHESLILFVRKTDDINTPYVTLELVKGNPRDKNLPIAKQFNRITQVYGYADSVPDKETCQFVMDFKKKFKLTGWVRRDAMAYE